MADRGDTHYHTPSLNRWFAFSSVLLLFASVWMVVDDWDAPWKPYQIEFREIEAERIREAIQSAAMQAEDQAASALQATLADAQGRLDVRRSDRDRVSAALFAEQGVLFTVSEKAKSAKQDLAWDRFVIEEHRVHERDPSYGADQLAVSLDTLLAIEGEVEIQVGVVEALEQEVAAYGTEIGSIESQIKGASKNLALLEQKLDSLDPEGATNRLANIVRDFPGLDFVDPRNRVQKQVLADLSFELNFTKGRRIDMCQTCHEAIDRAGYDEDWVAEDGQALDHPFLTHPRLDLYLTAKSPHPVNQVGCTICHRGAGQGLSFQHTDHRPAGAAQTEEWQAMHHWHKQHHWDYPMLSADYFESACVQCHKTTMELIAPEAPRLAKGYRLFEDKGCYACHKVDWFPTTRRPGPSLANLQSKFDADWLSAWITDPKSFRPSTKMPRIFNLSNTRPDEEVAKSKWGAGRSIFGQEWEDAAIASITAYLIEKSPKRGYPAPPQAGDVDRGRETFRVVGCLACHNLGGYPGEALATSDFVFELSGENEHGPSLRGVASKVDRNWLYAWIKDPAAYWPETQMPNLRLSDEDAADITAYIMDDPDGIFRDVPEGWQEGPSEAALDVLQEQARWFFSRDGRVELERRFAGENPLLRWDRKADLLVAVGEKFIGHQGCFSCHTINGFDDTNPIGTELSTWGSKTPDKLDWAFLPNILTHEHGWSFDQREEFKQYRENWLEYKLDDPRRFDDQKVKNPIERQRMPHFGLDSDEVLALSTFVVGLVNDEVQRAKMVPTPGKQSINDGLAVVRQQNCMACHMIDPGRITYNDEDGIARTVPAELIPIGDADLPPHQTDLASLMEDIENYELEMDEEVEDVGFRLLETVPEVGFAGESVFVELDDLLSIEAPSGGDFVQTILRYYSEGIEMHDAEADEISYWHFGPDGEVLDVDGVARNYTELHYDTLRWTYAPPVLFDEGHKLQREWLFAFLRDPEVIRPQMRVRMPSFNISAAEAGAVADYFAHKAEIEWAPRYTRSLRTALGVTLQDGSDGDGMPFPRMTNFMDDGNGISASDLAEAAEVTTAAVNFIEAGSAPDIAAKFPRIKAYGDAAGFRMNGPTNPVHELVTRRLPSHANHAAAGRNIATDGVNCFQCHWLKGQGPTQMETPSAWAPDLDLVRERLREDWVQAWLWNPALIYPGTTMPGNFALYPPQYQEAYPNSNNVQQIDAVLDWLYNLDSMPAGVKD